MGCSRPSGCSSTATVSRCSGRSPTRRMEACRAPSCSRSKRTAPGSILASDLPRMTIRISDPAYVDTLVAALLRGDCVPSRTGIHTIEIIHPFAGDDAEAYTELRFFLRAWQSAHPDVDLEVIR